jgi:hypothetical protein
MIMPETQVLELERHRAFQSIQKFPFTVKSVHDLTIAEHTVTFTGKAFYDIAHAPADHSNRRHSPKDYAVWEIHPVTKIEAIRN